MIAVIADDFTGAAEIGGIGLRHGLSVVIATELINEPNADLLVVATDTRSLPEKEAARITLDLTRELMKLKPDFIYKKIDSALRGNIASEISAQMAEMNKKRAIVIAANPVFKRIIHGGIYSIEGIPLNETNFSSDPEYPAKSALVKDIIGKKKYEVFTGLTPFDVLPGEGLIAGDVNNFGDLESWACRIDDNTLAAGASGFFNAVLSHKKLNKNHSQPNNWTFGENALYILGSTFPKNDNFLSKISQFGYYISNMPSEIYYDKNYSENWLDYWANDIIQAFSQHKKVFLTVSYTNSFEPGISVRVKEIIGEVMKKVTSRIKLDELIIEGGSTTSVILNHLGVKTLYPFYEIETGIIRMKMDVLKDMTLTTKPGSYLWPDSIWLSRDLNYIN
jgi:D-threonate/D-erythronate kinase